MNIRQGVLPCASEGVYMSSVSPKSLLAKTLHQAVRGALPPWPSTTRTQGTHGSDANATHPPSTSYSPSAGPWSCPRTGASHSRGKEILCKNTGSQRRQDSGQAWQGFCVNSSEQADFAQRGWSQQKAFPGREAEQGWPHHVSGQWVAGQNLMYLIEGR